mmetsp:Transcript_98/g.353  ORF Transcript_98/g.353 Transcript_98/m.353 type:complete len:436 (-) Transcript_98:379-1686(-)
MIPLSKGPASTEDDALLREALGKSTMFCTLDEGAIRKLMKHMMPIRFQSGDLLTHQGDRTRYLFVITEGDVRRLRYHPETGRLHHMETLGSDGSRNTVGALHVLRERPCYATTECLSDGVAYALAAEELRAVVLGDPKIAEEIMNALTNEIFNMSQRNRTPLLEQEGRPTNFLTISAAAAIESYYRSGVNAWLNSVLTKSPISNLFPNMHLQLPVRVLYINGLKGVREALNPYAQRASDAERIGLAVIPGVAMTPLSSVLEASNAGHMNPESMTTRWLRGIVPRAGREIVFGIGLNQLSDLMEERIEHITPKGTSKTLNNALGSVTSGLIAGYFSHIPHNLSTLKLMHPSKSYGELMTQMISDSELRAERTLGMRSRAAAMMLAFLAPRGLFVRSLQIAGSFTIINGLNYQFAKSAVSASRLKRKSSLTQGLDQR